MNKTESIEKLSDLVSKFKKNEDDYIRKGSTYNETEVRVDFINEFFVALGWDVLNKKGFSKPTRDVVAEANLREDRQVHRPDYEFRINSKKKFYVEAKKPSVDILYDKEPSYQTKRYGWNAKLPISILTNFRDLVVYDSINLPREDQDTHVGRVRKYHYTNFVECFDEIYGLLSFEAVASGSIDNNFGGLVENATEKFDDYFLKQIENWRMVLAHDLLENNTITQKQINEYIQIFINRLVFLRTCEDRELEAYGSLQDLDVNSAFTQLMELFQKADKTYDSGLFEMLENENNFRISNKVVVDIVKDLYLPNSPYSFSVVEPEILGDIYEEFIAKEIVVRDDSVDIQPKPEVKASNGVYTTPKYIVDYILKETLEKDIRDGLPEDYSIADIACGSGIFLLGAYDILLKYYLEKYIAEGNIKKLMIDSMGDYHLSIESKQKILINHIFGVDIDPHAVEVAKFSLYLKLIEDITIGELTELVNRKWRALPRLESNIQVGNSLIDKRFFNHKDIENTTLEEMSVIKPHDFEKKFSLLVGNPPYIKIQKMVQYSPTEVEFFNSNTSPYKSSRSNNFDKYMLFVERAMELMQDTGKVGFIIPNKFMKIKSGEPLRQLISKNEILSQLVDFDEFQVFGNRATTYTCIIILNKKSKEIEFEKVTNLVDWEKQPKQKREKFPMDAINQEPWIFSSTYSLNKEKYEYTLGDIAEIFVGLQTSADDIYIFEPESEDNEVVTFYDQNSQKVTIETAITKKAILDFSLNFFDPLLPNKRIIFPYKQVNNKAILFEENELKQRYPLAYKYLYLNKDKLESRHFSSKNPIWYQFGRSQSLQKFDEEKLIMKNPAKNACVVLDTQQIYFTGGGNGPYYGIRTKDSKYSHLLLSAILNSSLFDNWVKLRSSIFRGGYYSFSKQYIQDFPIFWIEKSIEKDVSRLEAIWSDIYMLANKSETEDKVSVKKSDYLRETSDELIEKIYKNILGKENE